MSGARRARDELVDGGRVPAGLEIALAQVQQVAARLHLARAAQIVESRPTGPRTGCAGHDRVARQDRAELDRERVERPGELVARDHERRREPVPRPRRPCAARTRRDPAKPRPSHHDQRPHGLVRRGAVVVVRVDAEDDHRPQPVGHDRAEVAGQALGHPSDVGCHGVDCMAHGCDACARNARQTGSTRNVQLPGCACAN